MDNEQRRNQKSELKETTSAKSEQQLEPPDVAESKRREWERQQEKKGRD